MITRKPILGDVAHGYNNNNCFTDAGIPYYQDNGDVNHCDKFVNDACFNYDDTTQTMNVTNACVHCDLVVDNDALICNDAEICGNACIDSNLTVTCAICGCSTLEIDDNAAFHCNATVDENLTVCCDAEVCNDMTVGCNTCLKGTLDVDGVSNFNCTVYVNGDLHVKGTSYDEHTVDLLVGADHITLRECATQGLGTQERAGIIIDHYDATGNKSLGIVGDYTGTARVGEIEIVHVWTTDDVTFYSDREMTTPIVIPDGKQLFQIGDTDPTTGEKEYYYVATDGTEPIATRSENMCDHLLTCWNATNCDIETIGSLPQNNGAILQYDVDSCAYCHLENPNAKGRLLTYDNECDKLKWSATSPTGTAQLVKWDDTAKEFTYLPVGNNGEVLTTCTSTPEYHWAVCAYNCNGNKYFEYPNAQIIDSLDGFESSTSGYAPSLYISWEDGKVIEQSMSGSRPAYVHDLADTVFGTSSSGPTAALGTFLCEITWDERQAMTTDNPNWWELSQYAYKSLEPIAADAQLVWKCQPSNYVFNTMSEYTSVAATIPANSQITILCETNYTTSEEV